MTDPQFHKYQYLIPTMQTYIIGFIDPNTIYNLSKTSNYYYLDVNIIKHYRPTTLNIKNSISIVRLLSLIAYLPRSLSDKGMLKDLKTITIEESHSNYLSIINSAITLKPIEIKLISGTSSRIHLGILFPNITKLTEECSESSIYSTLLNIIYKTRTTCKYYELIEKEEGYKWLKSDHYSDGFNTPCEYIHSKLKQVIKDNIIHYHGVDSDSDSDDDDDDDTEIDVRTYKNKQLIELKCLYHNLFLGKTLAIFLRLFPNILKISDKVTTLERFSINDEWIIERKWLTVKKHKFSNLSDYNKDWMTSWDHTQGEITSLEDNFPEDRMYDIY